MLWLEDEEDGVGLDEEFNNDALTGNISTDELLDRFSSFCDDANRAEFKLSTDSAPMLGKVLGDLIAVDCTGDVTLEALRLI